MLKLSGSAMICLNNTFHAPNFGQKVISVMKLLFDGAKMSGEQDAMRAWTKTFESFFGQNHENDSTCLYHLIEVNVLKETLKV